jgi:hypothetical protein
VLWVRPRPGPASEELVVRDFVAGSDVVRRAAGLASRSPPPAGPTGPPRSSTPIATPYRLGLLRTRKRSPPRGPPSRHESRTAGHRPSTASRCALLRAPAGRAAARS